MSVLDHAVSFVDGRVRLRHEALREAGAAELVRNAAGSVEGIRSVEVNTRTGSMLIMYDTSVLGREDLLRLAETGLSYLPSKTARRSFRKAAARSLISRPVTKLVNRVLIVSLAAAAVSACGGLVSVHRAAGAVLTVAGVQHFAAHRRTL